MPKGCVLSVYITHRFQLMMMDMDSNQLRSIASWTPTHQVAVYTIYLTSPCDTLDAANASDWMNETLAS